MDEKPITAEPVKKARSRVYRPTPDRFVIGLLLVICLLWLSERFQWFGFNHHKGWTVLISGAAIAVAGLVMLLWWAAGLIFHWRFQFGIRSLLAFCLASSIVAGWLAVEMKQARRQAEALEQIRTVGQATYDWEVDADYNSMQNPESPGPSWLRKTLGVDFLSAVAGVDLDYADVTDAGLEALKDLTRLGHVSLATTKTTDAGLEQLKGQDQLLDLSLSFTMVTDDGLKHIESMTRLQLLDLSGTTLTDGGLEHLKGLTQLQRLDLRFTRVTDAGVRKLQQALPDCTIYRYR